jgi:IS605 OrfB family transposase
VLGKDLAGEFPFAKKLNSMARQASAERAWSSISRFYENGKKGIKPVGFPKFKKHSRSVEYKTSGWKLLGPKRITFTDGFGIGELRLIGTWDLAHYDESLIKRVRLVRRADGYYVQFCSNDLVAYEDLNVKGLIRNRHLAKSISDAGWSTFRRWLEYFGVKYGKVTVAVPPHYTSQTCSNCGETVYKALSVRTHQCPYCGYEADRDVNAAINILRLGLRTVGHTGTYTLGEIGPLAGLEQSCSVKSGR